MFYSCQELILRQIRSLLSRNLSLYSVLPRKLCHVTAPHYSISVLLSVKWSFMGGWKQKKISNLALKVVAVAYERWLLKKRGSKYYNGDLSWKRLVFWKTGC